MAQKERGGRALNSGEKTLRTYKGNSRVLLIVCALTYLMWHTYDFLAWCRWALDIPYEIDLAKQRWARLWAVILGSIGIGNNLIMMILISTNRHRIRKLKQAVWQITDPIQKSDMEKQIKSLEVNWG